MLQKQAYFHLLMFPELAKDNNISIFSYFFLLNVFIVKAII